MKLYVGKSLDITGMKTVAPHGMLSNAFLGSIANNNPDRTDGMGTSQI